jgi:predicted ATPase
MGGRKMQLVRLAAKNFSSFASTGSINFLPGINLIVGQNNVGKSALLRAFDSDLMPDRHRGEHLYRKERLEIQEV